uniref:ABC transporter domain-containing protein n=1 Tax=Oryza punctata TaxID=4537 RepID=A0A0E0LCK4_ORYPU
MEKVWESGRRMSRSIGRGMGMEAWGVDEAFMPQHSGGGGGSRGRRRSGRGGTADDDEEALRWAAIERLPTYSRMRTAILSSADEAAAAAAEAHAGGGAGKQQYKEVDVRRLGVGERQEFIERVFRVAEEDNQRFLQKLRNRIDRVGIELPTVEVRFEQLTVQARCHVGSRALPTLLNTARNIAEAAVGLVGVRPGRQATLTILRGVSGVVRPSRMTLLLGPPSSGKTTLLLALAGKLDPSLRRAGEVTYNGFELEEFVPQKTAAYISQTDVHVGEMTVKETLDFSARCQGVGTKEKEAGIRPEPEVDLFMKATSMEGVESSLQTDYTLRDSINQQIHYFDSWAHTAPTD